MDLRLLQGRRSWLSALTGSEFKQPTCGLTMHMIRGIQSLRVRSQGQSSETLTGLFIWRLARGDPRAPVASWNLSRVFKKNSRSGESTLSCHFGKVKVLEWQCGSTTFTHSLFVLPRSNLLTDDGSS